MTIKTVALLAAMAGCGDPEPPPVTACQFPAGKECERQCVGSDDIQDPDDTCAAEHPTAGAITCSMVAVFEGERGCCRDAEPNVQRWYVCEEQ